MINSDKIKKLEELYDGIDFDLLRKQSETLSKLITLMPEAPGTPHLKGILTICNSIIDTEGELVEIDLEDNLSVVVSTYNGEGYSDIDTTVCNSLKEVEITIEEYEDVYFPDDLDKKVLVGPFDVVIPVEKDDSAGRIQTLVMPNKYTIIKVVPQINEAIIFGHYDHLKDAIIDLSIHVNGTQFNFELDDVVKYAGVSYTEEGLKFSSHDQKSGEFIYFEIIKKD